MGSPEELVALAREGSAEARERLIRRYTPLVLRIASRSSGRYVRLGEDDEVSIALMAFNEAIDGYDASRGTSFIGFAEVVVKRRLIDYFRRESAHAELPLSSLEEEDETGHVQNQAAQRQAVEGFTRETENWERRQEVMRYVELLRGYGISLAELVEVSPRHEDARRNAMAVARVLAGDPQLCAHLRQKKELPLRALESRVGLSRKTLERQRKYIIAVALVLMEDLTNLKEYLYKR